MKRKVQTKACISLAFLIVTSCGPQPHMELLTTDGLYGVSSQGKNTTASNASAYTSIRVYDVDLVDPKNTHGAQSSGKSIEMTGVEVVLDSNNHPFSGVNKGVSIKSLTVDADRIIVQSNIKLEQALVKLNAREIIFEKNGLINVSGEKNSLHASTSEESSISTHNGLKGYNSGIVEMNVDVLRVKGDANITRIVLNGGQGQAAGEGHDGSNGSVIPSLRKEMINGVTHDVLYVSEYVESRERLVTDNGSPKFVGGKHHVAQGTNQWPGNGEDAVPGGAPGAGGDGGQITINVNKIVSDDGSEVKLAKIVSLEAGKPGISRRTYKGGKAGSPEVSAKYFATYAHLGQDVIWKAETHKTKAGKDAISPQVPLEQSQRGILKVGSNPSISHSKAYYQQKLRFIRDQYIKGDFVNVQKVLDSDIKDLKKNMLQSSDLLDMTAKYTVLRNRLAMQQDYFGFSLRQAPLYALDFNLKQFEAEVEMALSNYFLVEKILMLTERNALKQEHIVEIMQQNSKLIASETEQQNIRQSKLAEASTLIGTVRNNETAYLKYLKDLNEQIQAEARKNVAHRNNMANLSKNLKTLASLAKVVPVGQPALAAAATVVEHISNVPANGSVIDWISYIDNTKSGLENTFSAKTLGRTQDSLNEFVNRLHVSNLENKDAQEQFEYMRNIYEDLRPAYENMASISKQFASNTVPQGELEQEIQRIQQSHPLFIQASVRLKDLVNDKSRLYDMVNKIGNDMLQTTGVIEATLLLSAKNQEDYLKNTVFGDTTLTEYTQVLRDMAEERLLYILHEVHKSYEYTTLQKMEQGNGVELLREKVHSLLKTDNNLESSVAILKAFYMTFVNKVVLALDNQFRTSNPIFLVKTDTVTIQLPDQSVQELNAFGTIALDLDESFYGSHQRNIRISSIEIDQASFLPASIEGKNVQKSFIQISHAGYGAIQDKNGKSYMFSYPLNESLHSWGASYQFLGNQVMETKIQRDEAIKSILGLLLGNKDNSLMYSPIFSQPAGLTQLRIEKKDLRGQHSLQSLRFKVNYTFF